jgi:DNA replication protein DnaC
MRQLTLDKLADLSLKGMQKALEEQVGPSVEAMPFEDRLLLLLDAEQFHRKERALGWRLKTAGLRQNARLEELDVRAHRTLDRTLLATLASCRWLEEKRNLILSGPCGIGKTFVACALARKACENQFSARHYRLPRLLAELSVARGQGTLRTKFASLARIDLLVLDDWLLTPLELSERRDLLELLDDRYDKRSVIVCTQLPVENWHAVIGDLTLADAILDRLVHNAHRLSMEGESMRKAKGVSAASGGNIDTTTKPQS